MIGSGDLPLCKLPVGDVIKRSHFECLHNLQLSVRLGHDVFCDGMHTRAHTAQLLSAKWPDHFPDFRPRPVSGHQAVVCSPGKPTAVHLKSCPAVLKPQDGSLPSDSAGYLGLVVEKDHKEALRSRTVPGLALSLCLPDEQLSGSQAGEKITGLFS